ncbi:putative phenylacetic acid degradation protein PaaD/phenylacetate-CoA oxygenase, PaaJ subunit [Streptomyces humidus]|uniref:Phenylacetic acid degradation protein PaaD/phenylacetate-CoA oxygenase, PaaJ subunit n=1 Tax=Streptomyces humidus TaxID=52259 RepID=A0A918L224_9ACTN|nr:1,2-phenylacetyl-CoA epoxidase subunit PaaD [Streptomyces humidus]GGR74316.1 putative phenylacetic acid degradation protein PaaD/phenylacetate-CoA oxygenase, PaaJ subunit [Streptomyces humidus]
MVTPTALEAELFEVAGSVPDPELPVLTLQELGVLRSVRLGHEDAVEVELTPTYTGCPAIEAMSLDIERALHEHGVREVTVRTVLTPAWSTDDISDEGRRKLREFGIAPPRTVRDAGPVPLELGPTRTVGAAGRPCAPSAGPGTGPGAGQTAPDPVRCPLCGSADTELLSRFSSTACKALRRCLACREPFDHFKEL